MTWLALCDLDRGWVDRNGLRFGRTPEATEEGMVVPRGSMMLEYRHEPSDVPQNIVRYVTRDPWNASFILRAEPDGGYRLMQRQADRTLEYVLDAPVAAAGETVRVIYHWDAPQRLARLACYIPGRGVLTSCEFRNPVPIFLGDMARIVTGQKTRSHVPPEFLAFADHQVPIGPLGGIGARTPVQTPFGPVEAQSLKAGQTVTGADGQPARVVFASLDEAPARGSFTPLLFRSPYHGLGQDILSASGQRLMLAGSEVEYLFGQPKVWVAAGHLVDSKSVLRVPELLTVRYCTILLDRPVALCADSLAMESLDPAVLRGCPSAVAGSILCDAPTESWPAPAPDEQAPILQDFEAQSYLRMRAA